MTHSEVIEYLAEHLEQSKSEVQRLLKSTTEVIKQALDRGYVIRLPRLGTFDTKNRRNRRGYHPQRGQYMILPPKRVVTFHSSTSLREHVKNRRLIK